jgi:cell division protein FtsI/penicillin-binding protein 2
VNNPLEDALAYLRRKAWAAGLAFFVLLLALGYRLWYLQVKQGAYYYAQAQNEALAPITLPAARTSPRLRRCSRTPPGRRPRPRWPCSRAF